MSSLVNTSEEIVQQDGPNILKSEFPNVKVKYVPKEKFVAAWLFVCSLLRYVTEILIEERLVIWNSKWKRIVMLVCNLPFKPSTFNQCF